MASAGGGVSLVRCAVLDGSELMLVCRPSSRYILVFYNGWVSMVNDVVVTKFSIVSSSLNMSTKVH